jgi:predicted ferric reductase
VLLPLAVARLTGYPLRFSDALAAGLGIVALAGLMLQVAASPCLRLVAARVGGGRVIRFHRMAGAAILAAALLHPVAFVVGDLLTDPGLAFARLGIMLEAPGLATGVVAACLLALLTGLAGMPRLPFSERLRRILHGAIAALVIVLALTHALQVGTFAEESHIGIAWTVLVAVALAASLALLHRSLRRPRLELEGGRHLGGDLVEIVAHPAAEGFDFRAGEFFRTADPRRAGATLPLLIGSSPQDLPVVRVLLSLPGDPDALAAFPEASRIAVDGPFGRALLETTAADALLLVVSGIGIAPALAVLRTMTFRRDLRPVRLVYGALSWDDLVFRSEIEALGRHLDLRFTYAVEGAEPEEAADRIDEALLAEALRGCDPDRVVALVCLTPEEEPPAIEALVELGVPGHAVVREPLDWQAQPPRDGLGRREAQRMALIFAGIALAIVVFALN